MNNVKKSIGWADFSANPVKGLCLVGCPYCYARRMYKRYHWDKTIRYAPEVFIDLPNKPSRIFVGSTIDLFHPLCSMWNDEILSICRRSPEHTFIFLTKKPENLIKWKFPDNCWVGISITTRDSAWHAKNYLDSIQAKLKFISVEPLLECPDAGLLTLLIPKTQWVICGAQTPYSPKTAPKFEWVTEIIRACDKAKIPVFLKDNLHRVFNTHKLRQDFPGGK